MKKTLVALLLVFSLLLTFALPSVLAEDGASADAGMNAILDQIQAAVGEEFSGDYMVEKIVKKLLISLQEEADTRGVSVEELLDSAVSRLRNEDGSFDILPLLGGLMSGDLFGSSEAADEEDENDDSMEELLNMPYFTERALRDTAVDAYVIDEYKDSLEASDVQFVFKVYVENEEGDPQYNLGYFELRNFKADGADLKLDSSASRIEYLAFDKNEAGEYVLTEAIGTEDGDGFESSLEVLLQKFGVTRESMESQLVDKDYYITSDIVSYLEKHPEYERIEYNGELKTLEEMRELQDAAEDAMWERALEGIDMSELAEMAKLLGGN